MVQRSGAIDVAEDHEVMELIIAHFLYRPTTNRAIASRALIAQSPDDPVARDHPMKFREKRIARTDADLNPTASRARGEKRGRAGEDVYLRLAAPSSSTCRCPRDNDGGGTLSLSG